MCIAALSSAGNTQQPALRRAPTVRKQRSRRHPALHSQHRPPHPHPPPHSAAAARRPFPNRANTVLPVVAARARRVPRAFEGFEGSGFVDDRDDSYALSRVRLNATVTASKSLSFQANVQDARVADKKVGPTTAPFRGPFDLRMAFADIGDAKGRSPCALGRQELAFGEQRLARPPRLGEHRAHVGRGARDPAREGGQVDVFGASLVRSLPDEFDKSGNGNRLAGVYAVDRQADPAGVGRAVPLLAARREPAQRARRRSARSRRRRSGARRRQAAGRLDYGVEMAMQRGSLAADSIERLGGHWQIRESLPGAGAVKLTVEYNFATGDDNPPTARARRSISSIRRATTSSGWPIRSAGATSTTSARASSSRRSRPRRSR